MPEVEALGHCMVETGEELSEESVFGASADDRVSFAPPRDGMPP
jgi:hypothetical protein